MFKMERLSKHISAVSQALREEVAELGEVGASFLMVWLILVLVFFAALLVYWTIP
jgi:uncharacterized RDD family membrane protein YckC